MEVLHAPATTFPVPTGGGRVGQGAAQVVPPLLQFPVVHENVKGDGPFKV